MPKPDELTFSVKKSLVAGSIVGAAAVSASAACGISNPVPRDPTDVQEDAADAGGVDGASDTDESDTSDATSDTEGDSFDPSSCPDGAICNPVPDTIGGDDAESSDADGASSGTEDAESTSTDT